MNRKILTVILGTLSICALAGGNETPVDYLENFVTGTPQIRSVNALAFGPQGILFVGDSKSASIFAIETDNTEGTGGSVEITGVDRVLASALGTTVDNISIQDLAVHPITKRVYVAVQHVNGTPALLVLDSDHFVPVKLDNIRFSSVPIQNVVKEDALDGRGRPLRVWTISDLGYYNGKVMVSGLSNQEFSSTFRSIPFPFREDADMASLEIYHASHGQYETQSPIKTFTATELDGKPYLVASYTCTPLVIFPIQELKDGQHVKGRTVAELGNRNTPLDMLTMKRDGKSYLLLANSTRALMRINYDEIVSFKESLSNPVDGTAGVHFTALPYVNVLQLDKLDDDHFVMLQRKADGNLNLMTVESGRL